MTICHVPVKQVNFWCWGAFYKNYLSRHYMCCLTSGETCHTAPRPFIAELNADRLYQGYVGDWSAWHVSEINKGARERLHDDVCTETLLLVFEPIPELGHKLRQVE